MTAALTIVLLATLSGQADPAPMPDRNDLEDIQISIADLEVGRTSSMSDCLPDEEATRYLIKYYRQFYADAPWWLQDKRVSAAQALRKAIGNGSSSSEAAILFQECVEDDESEAKVCLSQLQDMPQLIDTFRANETLGARLREGAFELIVAGPRAIPESAVHILAKLGDKGSRDALIRAREQLQRSPPGEPSREELDTINEGLAILGDEEAIDYFIREMGSDDRRRRETMIMTAGFRIRRRELIPKLYQLLGDPQPSYWMRPVSFGGSDRAGDNTKPSKSGLTVGDLAYQALQSILHPDRGVPLAPQARTDEEMEALRKEVQEILKTSEALTGLAPPLVQSPEAAPALRPAFPSWRLPELCGHGLRREEAMRYENAARPGVPRQKPMRGSESEQATSHDSGEGR